MSSIVFVRVVPGEGEPTATWYWNSSLIEGNAARNLSEWDVPCLVYVGAEDADFFVGAKRAANEIPSAHFVALEGLNHLQTHANVDQVLPHVRRMIHG
jgi:pimeloyl-ACP methyl ester carboxylesterase